MLLLKIKNKIYQKMHRNMFKNKTIIYYLFIVITSFTFAQNKVTVSGKVIDKATLQALPFVNIVLQSEKDKATITGVASNEEGRFTITDIPSGDYILELSYIGYKPKSQPLFIGNASAFLDIKNIEIEEDVATLANVVVTGTQSELSQKLDKKTYTLSDNVSQSGGSVLQAIQNLPSVTTQDGKIQLRGNDKVMVLIDGKQTALTGFGNQSGLDNLPASAIEKIEIINNPSAKFDANGNAGIINIIYKKNKNEGLNGKMGLTSGLGSLWERKENLPTIRPQYSLTPKINPSFALNYKKNKINLFLQSDYLYTENLNKNEFVTRTYNDGTSINQQTKRNRNTHFTTTKAGFDYYINEANTLTISGLFGTEKIIDNGDEPFFNADLSNRLRLWQFLEDELKTTAMGTASFTHQFKQPGHQFNTGLNYTFHRENEKYFFTNILPTYTGYDSFKLLSDEKVLDFNFDYTKPLQFGKIETGIKYRKRTIPVNMQFFPGLNSPLDVNAGGWANYNENIPAIYGTYSFENKNYEAEIGLRVEYVNLQYDVNPDHNTYKSSGYNYTQPFPNLRFGYKLSDNSKLSIFYNRRVDRPNEVDIRIFPKYDDAEIIKVGNPSLRPQFTNTIELGYKYNWESGSIYNALYHKFANQTITRISSTVNSDPIIYAVFQNAGKSYNTGLETVISQKVSNSYKLNINFNVYQNQINAFSVVNLYPIINTFSAATQKIVSGNFKVNNNLSFKNNLSAQISAIYYAPDIIPQGKIKQRFTLDFGLKKGIQKGKGEFFINASDLFNTLVLKKEIQGTDFSYTSNDYYETQVIRLGYTYKF